jgi:Ca2+/Na+ antiporter
VVVVIVNALATTIPLGGMTTGQLSDLYPNLFVPAGVTFSIWGLIYLLLGIYVVYGLVFSARKAEPSSSFIEKVGILFLLTCLANAGWIFSWQYRFLPISLVCMLILLLSLIYIYRKLKVGRSNATSSEKYLVHLPISIYIGWISIATIANVTALLVYYKWDRFGITEQVWAIAMILVGLLLGLLTLFYRKDIFYAFVVDWALLGILIKRMAVDAKATQGVIVVSIIGMCLLTLGVVVQIVRGKVYR